MADLTKLTPAQRATFAIKSAIALREEMLRESQDSLAVVQNMCEVELRIANRAVREAEENLAKAKAMLES